jgi:nucleoside diphosphate kinase
MNTEALLFFPHFPPEQLLTRQQVHDRVFVQRGDPKIPKRIRIENMMCEVSRLENERLLLISEILSHPEFKRLIDEGYVTLAAIKPHTEKTLLPEKIAEVVDDISGERAVLDLIQPPLQNIFQISLALTPRDLQEFYPGLKERIPPKNWKKFKDSMLSGPVTYIVLYSEDGNAIEEWRRQIGKTDPETARKETPDTIRALYARSIANNIVHGSASIDDVRVEIGWLKNKINFCRQSKQS